VQIKIIALSSLAAAAVSIIWMSGAYLRGDKSLGASVSHASARQSSRQDEALKRITHGNSPVCEALKKYPKAEDEKLSFEAGEISAICRPFVKLQRHELDRCGDAERDPYTVNSPALSAATASSSSRDPSSSKFTWASRSEMSKRGKYNLFADPEARDQREVLMKRIGELKDSARQLCCGNDLNCQSSFMKVDVSLCKPQEDPNAPDPCVFGGSYKMPGEGYTAIFRVIQKIHGSASATEFKRIAEKNLGGSDGLFEPMPDLNRGNIVLSSYVSKAQGVAALEPVILHELGHACSMVRMQQNSLASRDTEKSLRATRWLDSARSRCNQDIELPEAYYDFWESLGESHKFAACLYQLATDNQKQKVDHSCPGLCPGHYMEESVGIAFSLLSGDVSGLAQSVFPNTCDHVRDGQHPMVSDVAECLVQNSPRFRDKLKRAYGCG
jgi:hypothetical protein